MLGQFSESTVHANSTRYQPKLLKSQAEVSLFHDVLNSLEVLDMQKRTTAEKANQEIHISIKL